jgi:hypothetical protein
MAIITRWRIPRRADAGYSCARRAASGMPTDSSIATARAQAALAEVRSWTRTTSAIWSPTLNTGFSAVIGSWKIMAMRRPRTARSSRSGRPSRSRPSNSTSLPASMRPGGRMSRSTESAVTDLPHPLSPTMPSVSPGSTSKETPSTERATPASVWNQVRRSRTASTGAGVAGTGAS